MGSYTVHFQISKLCTSEHPAEGDRILVIQYHFQAVLTMVTIERENRLEKRANAISYGNAGPSLDLWSSRQA